MSYYFFFFLITISFYYYVELGKCELINDLQYYPMSEQHAVDHELYYE
jgi:hypothetical protein